ncbi:HNH endonuclease [Aliarcobacter butzleri]|uniref:HNH endonuclease n=1 Tax=Aliarcobacter butzleri TaxID=28197 RepID=UPI001919DCE6|nr:hypothetical protein [Aliarcobacter butzleri]
MLKLNYSNYLRNKNFDFEKAYYKKLVLSKFEKPKKSSKNKTLVELLNNSDIFKTTKGKDRKKISILRFYRYFIETKKLKNLELKKVILEKPNVLIEKIGKIKSKTVLNEIIKDIFNYSGKFQSDVITPFFTENFDFRTCFYCNKDFITNFDADKKVSTFQLDHFYDKDTYPYLALSFYNLIPSCPTCNSSKVKGSKNTFEYDSNIGKFQNETCIAPNDENFDFHQKVKFKLLLDASCKNLHIKSKDDIDITLKEQFTDIYTKYIEIFKLNERYKAHKDIVFDMIQKAELYPESRLRELQDLTGIPFQQIKKDIFNLIDENEDLSQQQFSKLIVDMSKELGIL